MKSSARIAKLNSRMHRRMKSFDALRATDADGAYAHLSVVVKLQRKRDKHLRKMAERGDYND